MAGARPVRDASGLRAQRVPLSEGGGPGVRLKVKAVPGASRHGIAGWLGDALKVRVTAPAEGGAANAAIRELLAAALDVPTRRVRIAAGGSSPRKVVEVTGIGAEEARRRIETALTGSSDS